MLAILVLAIGLSISASALLTADSYHEQIDFYRQALADDSMRQIFQHIEESGRLTHTFPTEVELQSIAKHYEQALDHDLVHLGYATAATLLGRYEGERAILFYLDPEVMPHEDFLGADNTMNGCGSSEFSEGEAWCLPTMAKAAYRYHLRDSSEWATDQILEQRGRLKVLAHKVAEYHRAHNRFPVVANGTYDLRSVVGLGPSAACDGIYNWSDIPVDCSDLDAVWHTQDNPSPVKVYREEGESIDRFILYTRAPFDHVDGSAAVVYFDLTL